MTMIKMFLVELSYLGLNSMLPDKIAPHKGKTIMHLSKQCGPKFNSSC